MSSKVGDQVTTRGHLLALTGFLGLSWLVCFAPMYASAVDVPGNLGDARFNIYVLEHVYQWLIGRVPSLLSPPMFHPYPNTLGFSDNHAGSALVYAAFRALGSDPYQAYKGWLAAGYVGTLVATYIVLARFDTGWLIAGLGAFIYAFSLPAVELTGHAQLAYRCAVPFAFWYTVQVARDNTPADWYKLAATVAVQTLCSIYLGLFTVIDCALLFVALRYAPGGSGVPGAARLLAGIAGRFGQASATEHRADVGHALPTPSGEWQAWWPVRGNEPHQAARGQAVGQRRDRAAVGRALWSPALIPAAVLVALLVLDLGFHHFVSRQYQLTRAWGEIYSMLPRWQSYLILDSLPYWSSITQRLPDVPMRHEHQLFLGIPTLGLLLAALVLAARSRVEAADERLRLMRAVAISLVLAFMMYLAMGSITIYRIVALVPGFGAIRAVARHIVVTGFPVVLAGCLLLAGLRRRPNGARLVAGLAAAVIAWHAADIWLMHKVAFSGDEARQRIAVQVAAIKARDWSGSNHALAYFGRAGDEWYVKQIDALLIAQKLGIATLNGYSGNVVPGHDVNATCAGFVRQLAGYARFAKPNGLPDIGQVWLPPLVVGSAACAIDRETVGKLDISGGPALSRTAAAAVRLAVVSNVRGTGGWTIVIRVSNPGREIIHALGANPFRLSWAVADGRPLIGVGWGPRIELTTDIPAGGQIDVPVFLADAALTGAGGAVREVAFSFVVEGMFWGHTIRVAPLMLRLDGQQ